MNAADGVLGALGATLAALEIDSLQHPERLPWLLAFVAVALFLALRRRRSALAWPSLAEARDAGAGSLEMSEFFAKMLRAGALLCLVLVLCEPAAIRRAPPEPGLGIDLVLVVDTSGSMRALDTELRGETRTRLDLAVEAVTRFATHRVEEGDRAGLVVFGESAFTQCPLTGDGVLLRAALERVRVGMAGEATALGDALGLAVKRASRSGEASGSIVVLLTDGRSNAGRIPLDVAAELAAARGVRVHTVAIGNDASEVVMAEAPGAPQRGLRFESHDPDRAALKRVAAQSGGRFFEARRAGDLAAVYAEIDSLERRERPLPPRIREVGRPEPLLAAAGALLFVEIGVARILRRRLA